MKAELRAKGYGFDASGALEDLVMYPRPFHYHRARFLQDAAALMSQLGEEAKLIAGGQSLVPLMKLRLANPAHLVDPNFIPNTSYIKAEGETLRFGAMTRHGEIENSETAARLPVVHDCAAGVADVQVRNRGTIGGSLDRRGSAEHKRVLVAALTRRDIEPAVRRARAKWWRSAITTPEAERARIKVKINGKLHELAVEPRTLMVETIRENLDLTGTHVGCDTTYCGACTVLLNGLPVKSCTMFAVQADGAEITTVEGIEENGRLHPLQQAFVECHALQGGYCTPGMLLSGIYLLSRHPHPTEQEVRKGIAGNTCRCTGYQNIFKAFQAAGSSARK